MIREIMYVLMIGATVASYIYLITHFIKEKIYKALTVFDLLVLISGPIGLFVIIVIGYFSYDDEQ
jgi:hypothetical protein